jgi:hypothetical protein
MHTSWGQPLSMNPVNAIVYNPDDYSDESEDAQEAFEKKRFVFQCTNVQRVVSYNTSSSCTRARAQTHKMRFYCTPCMCGALRLHVIN